MINTINVRLQIVLVYIIVSFTEFGYLYHIENEKRKEARKKERKLLVSSVCLS